MTQLEFNLSDEQLNEWATMTDNNDHTGVRLDIISYFSSFTKLKHLRAHKKIMEGVALHHDMNRSIMPWVANVRNEVFEDFMERLSECAGNEIYNKVNGCL